MSDVNFIARNSIKNKVAVTRNNNDARSGLVDFATLIWCVRQIHGAID